jgi:branched-chain amino acid transport system ATP-binding protein
LASNLLQVSDLQVRYGGIQAVRGVTLAVGTGEVVCVLGRNGAGKSSLVRAIAGVERTSGGRIEFADADVTRWSSARRAHAGISLVPEDRRAIAPLTVRENLMLAGPSNKRERQARYEEALALFPALVMCRDQLSGSLSGGQQQMLVISRALMSRPRLLILDEPSLGLAPLIVEDVYETIRQVTATGQSVLLIEQNAALALELATTAYLMNHGEMVRSGPPSDFTDLDVLYQSYL